MRVTEAKKNPPGEKVYYVEGESGNRYTVLHVRRAGMDRWSCTCSDFVYRREMKGSHRSCKHILRVKETL
jgi:predicted nucleic acid-binding Zn finger protein